MASIHGRFIDGLSIAKGAREAGWLFGNPVLVSGGSGTARWQKGLQSLSTHQKGGGWVANLYGGVQSGDDWAACYIPTNELPVTQLDSLYWSWYQTNTETMGLGVVIWIHDPTDFDKRAEVTQIANTSGLDKASGWNSHEFDSTTTQMFFYGENTTGTDLTAGTQYTWDEFQADTLFKTWSVYRISFDWGWEASGTFESSYLAEVKINGVYIPLKPPIDEIATKCGPWCTVTVAKSGTASSETNLGGEYKNVQVYNPALDSATITVKPSRLSGDTAVQAYTFDADATGDFANATTARTTAGMNVFRDIYAQFVTIVCGAAQSTAARTFYIRGVDPI